MNIPPKQRILKMFGEYATIKDEKERDEARSYLHMWKKYLLRRLARDSYDVKIIDMQWGEKASDSMLCLTTTIYLKIIIEFEWKYDDHISKLEDVDIREDQLPEGK